VGSLLVKIRSVRKKVKRFFYPLAIILSWWSAHFSKSDALYKDRFANDHEVADLSTQTWPTPPLHQCGNKVTVCRTGVLP
jgi:hypothetical protein